MPKFTARMEYLKAIYERYHKALRIRKSQILDEFCTVCDYNRKYALRLLNGPAPDQQAKVIRRKRGYRYSIGVLQIAQAIWKASGYLCGQRLKEAIPLWLPAARPRFHITPDQERQLLAIGPRQLDARLQEHKKQLKRRFYSTTRPGRLLKSMIPIRTFNHDIKIPGYLEIDTVAHCGNSLQGDFLYTLTATDIFTGWTERVALYGKGQTGVVEALKKIQARLPFRLLGIDSDNGEEFINYHLLYFCRKSRPQIAFTRSRVNKKNDNPHVEQKNWTHVRAFLGWQRFDSTVAQDAINALYDKELLWFQNGFQPSLKLKSKIHIGSKTKRTYERAQTPLDRLIASGIYHRRKVKALKALRGSINPFILSETIDNRLAHLTRLASRPTPTASFPAPARPSSFNRPFTFRVQRQTRMMKKAIQGDYFKTFTSQQRRIASVTS
jgi:hypothetical protein